MKCQDLDFIMAKSIKIWGDGKVWGKKKVLSSGENKQANKQNVAKCFYKHLPNFAIKISHISRLNHIIL